MKRFETTYIRPKSFTHFISNGLIPVFVAAVFFSLIKVYGIAIPAILLFILQLIFLLKGDGKLSIEKNNKESYFNFGGNQKKIKKIDFGWSYNFNPPVQRSFMSPYDATHVYGNSSRSNSGTSNTISLNSKIELENGETIVVTQELAPWCDIPKEWRYIGNELACIHKKYLINSGIKKIRNLFL